MEKRARAAIDAAVTSGASYADARVVDSLYEHVAVKNGAPSGLESRRDRGIGIRVIADGAWGFAATGDPSESAIRATAQLAVDIAKASATTITEAAKLADVEPAVAEVAAAIEIDPASVPLEDRVALLMECDALMRKSDVVVAEGYQHNWLEKKFFVSSEGAAIYQECIQCGAGLEATAANERESQVRSYPSAHGGQTMARGFEVVQELDMKAHAQRVGEDAVALLSAPQCPSGKMDVILVGPQLALQLHESCGHPIELDRVLGTEASYAGTSFLTPEKLGNFRYGSEHVNITADATLPGGLGSFAYDDEGVPAQRVQIVEDGIFKGYLSSRETAAQLNLGGSGGAMRADGWIALPIIRMTNVNLEPGDMLYEDIIASTERGIIMAENVSWSIDDKRLNFQFGAEMGYLIEDGQIVGFVRNPTYNGITPEFWGSCDAVADEKTWRIWGVTNCGKGEPGQTARVGHGVSAARFRNVTVGVLGDE